LLAMHVWGAVRGNQARALRCACCGRSVEYQISVITSDLRGAGTDGEVYIALKGEKGERRASHALLFPVQDRGPDCAA
jgi:hypothetical protein